MARSNFSPPKFFCCQVNNNPASSSYRTGLIFGCFGCLRCCSYRSIVVVCNYLKQSDNGGTMPSESLIFTTCVDPISPPSKMVEVPGTAPGSAKLILKNVYHHSHQNDFFTIQYLFFLLKST